MNSGQTEGASFSQSLMHCYTRDGVEVSVMYTCHTSIIHNKSYRSYINPKDARTLGWRDRLQQQIQKAITYVVKHYRHLTINDHKNHIERQIQKCLNENYMEETNPLSSKGLAIKAVEVLKVDKRAKLY
jgi:hypothetical protein